MLYDIVLNLVKLVLIEFKQRILNIILVKINNTVVSRYLAGICLFVLFSISACGEDQTTTAETQSLPVISSEEENNLTVETKAVTTEQQAQNQFHIGNKRYLFDVSNHTVEELEGLLARIEEIIEVSPEAFDNLEMVMVLHGPDIDLFTQQNYSENKQLVDLAAKLDAFKVVDMKACETAMGSLGVEREDIPPFIELVPYAPDTIRTLEQEGYINL